MTAGGQAAVAAGLVSLLVDDGPDVEAVLDDLTRLVSFALSPRRLSRFPALTQLPAVRAHLAANSSKAALARAVVSAVSLAMEDLGAQVLRGPGLAPVSVTGGQLSTAIGRLLAIEAGASTAGTPATERRREAAVALELDLAALGGDRRFREHWDRILLMPLASSLALNDSVPPKWVVERVRYLYEYGEDAILKTTICTYDVISKRPGTDFKVNHTAPPNYEQFELVGYENCQLVSQTQLHDRTLELHLRLRRGGVDQRTSFQYRLAPKTKARTDEPVLATIGQLDVQTVEYHLLFAVEPRILWRFDDVPPPLEGAAETNVPRADDPRVVPPPCLEVFASFRHLKVRFYHGVAWRW